VFELNFRMCASVSLWIYSRIPWTIWYNHDNNYEDMMMMMMMAHVVCWNMLENWKCVKNSYSACKVGTIN